MLDGREEGRHSPDGDPRWREDHVLRWDDADAGISGALWVTYDGLGAAVYRSLVTGTTEGEVGLVAEATGVAASTTELRTDGLWADWVVAEPFGRVSLDAEAFAVTLDVDASVGADSRGDRVPFGFELDAESSDPPERVGPAGAAGATGYRLGCRVGGLLLVGAGEWELSAEGWRSHTWGGGSVAAAHLVEIRLDPLLGRFELG